MITDHHKQYLFNSDPLKPHFYIVKLRFTGLYIISLILKNIDCGYSLELPLCFEQKYEKMSKFFICKFLEVKFSAYLNRHVFVMQ